MTDQQSPEDPGRVIDLSVEVPGTPEEVWDTIATGPGITSWFVPHRVEERQGGAVRMDFGPGFGEEGAEVAVWEPPHRLVMRSPGERGLAYEWLVEARDGGTCVVRLVNSGFGPGEDWDADFDGMSAGWRIFLDHLRLQRIHFPGRRARAVIPTAMTAGPADAAFQRLCAELGAPADAEVGDRLTTSGDGVPPLGGTVLQVDRTPATVATFLLLDTPTPGTAFLSAEGAGEHAAVSTYLYLYGEAAEVLDDVWTPFLQERFPAPVAAPEG